MRWHLPLECAPLYTVKSKPHFLLGQSVRNVNMTISGMLASYVVVLDFLRYLPIDSCGLREPNINAVAHHNKECTCPRRTVIPLIMWDS